ncbi:leucine-rich repeat domain-containing protein [Alistipes sp.]|uniref:leucine-rich repeat domain-containing protein n=1 Tax=Alistipes sp. TaxID=1872444 RepID=UPI003AF1A191
MRYFLSLLLLFCATACGLAESERDERNKRNYLTFSDPAFEAYCLEAFDTDHDGRISRYEAQHVRAIDCPDRGIARMNVIGEFTRLERLDCSDNLLEQLDLANCTLLRTIDCSSNRLFGLDINGLRGLTSLDCSDNLLTRLDLKSNSSLAQLDCAHNLLTTLDVSACSLVLRADTRSNPDLTTVYCLAQQSIDFDGPTQLILR